MSKKQDKQDSVTNTNTTKDLFIKNIVPFIKSSIESAGGLENFLATYPQLASHVKQTSQNPTSINWLRNNSPFNITEINNSFAKLNNICDQQLNGETCSEDDNLDSII